jgi:DNA-binding NarL/FixJ family response regulator
MSQRRPPVFDLIGPELANLPRRQKRERLTQRDEMFILWARSQGLSFRSIAARLNATTCTVHRHYRELLIPAQKVKGK